MELYKNACKRVSVIQGTVQQKYSQSGYFRQMILFTACVLCNHSLLKELCHSFVSLLFFWCFSGRFFRDSLPGISYAKSCCLVQKDDKEGEAQGDSEKVSEDITMRCHFNDFNTRATLQ